ncbi:MAG: ATP-binding cassette domain-containing protein, partial [Pseudomonadota bacterium]
AQDLAEQLGIAECMDRMPGQLSVGQRQRAAIARAAACAPAILLADEPTSALDPELKAQAMRVFQEIAARGTSVLIVTHDTELVRDFDLPLLGQHSEDLSDGWRTIFTDRVPA